MILVVCVRAGWKFCDCTQHSGIRRAGQAVRSSTAPLSKYLFGILNFHCAEHDAGVGGRRILREANPSTTDALEPKWYDGHAFMKGGMDDGGGTRQLPSPRSAFRGIPKRPPQGRSIVTPTS